MKNESVLTQEERDEIHRKQILLMKYVVQGDFEAARTLLQTGIDPNEKTTVEEDLVASPLVAAAACNRVQMMQLLLDHGADVHATDEEGYTPLCFACLRGFVDAAKLLLENGAAVHAKSRSTDAFIAAIVSDKPELIHLLAQYGAQTKETADGSATPLHIAVSAKATKAAEALIACGADPNSVLSVEVTPLIFAIVQLSDENMVEVLLNGGALPRSLTTDSGATLPPLHLAVVKRLYNISSLLIEHGADVNERFEGETCLIVAATRGLTNHTELLIKNKADLDAVLPSGEAAIHYAAKNNHLDVVKQLAEAGADINLETAKGTTPLHIASENGEAEMVDFLLHHGADPLAKNEDTMMPLHLASLNGHFGTAKLLLTYMPSKPVVDVTVLAETEEELRCPITWQIMTDPVTAADGCSYERAAITKWLQSSGVSPMTKQEMTVDCLVPNLNLKQQILAYLESRAMLE